jgi:hypothetical protein
MNPDIATNPVIAARPTAKAAAGRLFFIDNIRWVMIMLVLSMHAAVTYSGHGSWYYNEPSPVSRPEDLIFLTYQFFLQSFFMGLLFFVAGYFVPGAFDKKGPGVFLKDRAFRLGWPSLLWIFVLQPVTGYYAAGNWAAGDPDRSFFREYAHYITRGRFLSGNGPLWFCIALLFFCCCYAGWRVLTGDSRRVGSAPAAWSGRFPGTASVLSLILLIAVCSFLVRIPWPNGTSFYNMQFCYFSEYVAFFIAGTLAWRRGWLTNLPTAVGRRWGLTAVFLGLIYWIALLVLGGAFNGQGSTYGGGWHWQSAGLCLLEAFAGTGISIGCLALFREKFNRQGKWAAFFSANAFAVYVFHPPILIAITRLMGSQQVDPLVKFLLATVLSIVASFAICGLVIRKIPVLKSIL